MGLSVLEIHQVWISEAFLIPDSVLLLLFLFKKKADLRRVLKFFKKNSLGFKVPVLRHIIPVGFQRWFLDKRYQKFCYFEHWIACFLFLKLLQNIKIKWNMWTFDMSKSSSLSKESSKFWNSSSKSKSFSINSTNWKMVYNQF